MNLNISYNWLKFRNKRFLKYTLILGFLLWFAFGLGYSVGQNSCLGEDYLSIGFIPYAYNINKERKIEISKDTSELSMCLDGGYSISGFPFQYSESGSGMGINFNLYLLLLDLIIYFIFVYLFFLIIDKVSDKNRK